MYLWVCVFFCGLDLTVKQLIFRKTLAISLDENLTQGSAHLQECLTPVFQAPCWVTSGMKWGAHVSALIFKALHGPLVRRSSSPWFIMNHWHLDLIETMLLYSGGWKFRWAINFHCESIDTGITNESEWIGNFWNRQNRNLNHVWEIILRIINQIWQVEDGKKIHSLSFIGVSAWFLHMSIDLSTFESAWRYTYLFFQEKSWAQVILNQTLLRHLSCIIFYCVLSTL